MTRVWDNAPCAGPELLCFLAIADNANDQGLAWPSIPYLSRKTRRSDRQTLRTIASLIEQGLLSRREAPGKITRFEINLSKLAASKPVIEPDDTPVTDDSPTKVVTPDIPGTPPMTFSVETPDISGMRNKEGTVRNRKSNQKPSAAAELFEHAPDPKPDPKPTGWERIIAAINESYTAANKGVNTPFTPRFFQRLRQLIAAADWKPEDWIACVQNRAKSDDANMADPPQNFVEQLMRYRSGPLDQYHLAKGRKKNGSSVQPISRTTAVNRAALEEYRASLEQAEEDADSGNGGGDRPRDEHSDERRNP